MSEYPRTPYFGESWDAPICDGAPNAATPIGVPCNACNYPIEDGDQGLIQGILAKEDDWRDGAIHRECMIRGIVGTVKCQQGIHPCNDDEETMSPLELRNAARAATAYFLSHTT